MQAYAKLLVITFTMLLANVNSVQAETQRPICDMPSAASLNFDAGQVTGPQAPPKPQNVGMPTKKKPSRSGWKEWIAGFVLERVSTGCWKSLVRRRRGPTRFR
jgi:hypothetical protein